MTGVADKHGAMQLRSPLARQRPWISDTVWIAHETLPLFDRIASLMSTDGWWTLGEDGATRAKDRTFDLVGLMEEFSTAAQPCVVHHNDYVRQPDLDDAMQHVGEQAVEVIAADGGVWWFDQDIFEVASLRRGLSWSLAPSGRGAALVGADRKGRPRFALMSLSGSTIAEQSS